MTEINFTEQQEEKYLRLAARLGHPSLTDLCLSALDLLDHATTPDYDPPPGYTVTKEERSVVIEIRTEDDEPYWKVELYPHYRPYRCEYGADEVESGYFLVNNQDQADDDISHLEKEEIEDVLKYANSLLDKLQEELNEKRVIKVF